MLELSSRYLCTLDADVDAPLTTGPAGPIGARSVANIAGGTVEGERLSGAVLASGADWLVQRADGVMALDVRALVETHDGARIYVTYVGYIKAAPEVAARLFNPQTQASVDPSEYYFRTNPVFETGDARYAWLNSIVAVGVGQLRPGGVKYTIHEIV
ncbi:MAG: DUF3237 domain-containing protein [Pseudomonadota bacterium]